MLIYRVAFLCSGEMVGVNDENEDGKSRKSMGNSFYDRFYPVIYKLIKIHGRQILRMTVSSLLSVFTFIRLNNKYY